MENPISIVQILIAASIWIVWVFRFDNIVREFEQYRYPAWFRNLIGATKITLAALLVAGIWYPNLVFYSATSMAMLMMGAQVTHIRVKNPLIKFVPSLLLLILSVFVAYSHMDHM
ncbi:MAG: DoxX family protein [Bdellovibrionales bacterium]|nr:DoxX family protein [Bdellovibrionales bacterium]